MGSSVSAENGEHLLIFFPNLVNSYKKNVVFRPIDFRI